MPQRKKHPSARARANRAATSAALGGPLPEAERPELPETRDWHPATVAWWDDIWASPMSAEWHSSDLHGLLILAVLMDKFWNEPTEKAASEIRLQRQAFGLTPYDRRRLEWTIESAADAKERGRARRAKQSPPEPDEGDDPRLVLVG